MLPVAVIFRDAEFVRDAEVGEYGGRENRVAVTVHPASTFRPGSARCAQLLNTVLIEAVLNMVINKIPDVEACLLQ